MPILKVSFIGIAFGIIVGFLTVILSAIIPAKKLPVYLHLALYVGI